MLERDVRLNKCWKLEGKGERSQEWGKCADSVCCKAKTQLKQKRSKGIRKDQVGKMLIRKEALEPVGCWEGPGPDAKTRVSGRAHAHQFPLVPRPPVSLSPQWATAAPTSPGDPPDQQAGLTQAPVESLLLLGPSVHVTLWAYQEQNLFPPSPVELLHSSPAGPQSQMLFGLLLPMPEPQTGEPNMGLRILTPVREPMYGGKKSEKKNICIWIIESLSWTPMAIYSSTLAWRILMDKGAWRATIYAVTKSRTRRSN